MWKDIEIAKPSQQPTIKWTRYMLKIQIEILQEDHFRSFPKTSDSNEEHDGWIKPKTPNNYNWTLKILCWNARSIKKELGTNNIMAIISEKKDIAIIIEIWMDEPIKVMNTCYHLFQTTYSKHQWVATISKEELDLRLEF